MSCLVTYKPKSPLTGKKLNFVKHQIKEILLEQKAKAAYLFGSCARGNYSAVSDIDLLIINDSDKPFVERPFEFPQILKLHPNIDLLVYTEEEFNLLKTRTHQGFTKQMFQDLEKLF